MVWIARCLHVPASETQKPCYCCLRRRDEHDGGRACMASRNHRGISGNHSLAGSRKVRRLSSEGYDLTVWDNSSRIVFPDCYTFRDECDSISSLRGITSRSLAMKRIVGVLVLVVAPAVLAVPSRLRHLSLLRRPATTARVPLPPKPLHTPAMLASIALATTIAAPARRRRATTRNEWGARRLPIFRLLCRLGSEADCAQVFGRRAPRERCVQFWFSSKPGGVMLPPEPDELTLLIYSC